MHLRYAGNNLKQHLMPTFSNRSLTNVQSFKWDKKAP